MRKNNATIVIIGTITITLINYILYFIFHIYEQIILIPFIMAGMPLYIHFSTKGDIDKPSRRIRLYFEDKCRDNLFDLFLGLTCYSNMIIFRFTIISLIITSVSILALFLIYFKNLNVTQQ